MGQKTSKNLETPVNFPGGEKVRGIQLPGQSGKTKKMQEYIAENMNTTRAKGNRDDFNIVISSNNKLLVDQTTKRMADDLGPRRVENELLELLSLDSESTDSMEEEPDAILRNGASSWTSAQNKTPEQLCWEIISNEISMIVCCAHPKRFKKLVKMLIKLQKSPYFKGNINIWIDEAHKSIKLWKKYLKILEFSKIRLVTLVSATFDPIDRLFNVRRFTYETTHPAVYHSLADSTFHIVECVEEEVEQEEEVVEDEADQIDLSSNAPKFLEAVLNNPTYREMMEQPGQCWFTPGNNLKSTHNEIAKMLRERKWNGIMLNGEHKHIYVGERTIDYIQYNSGKAEAKDVLAKLFGEFPLLRSFPFFVTGLNCLKEGITFQGPEFLFHGEVIPDIPNQSDLYQLICRGLGNIKHLPIYKNRPADKKLQIICTEKMKKNAMRQENIDINLPRILWEAGRDLPTNTDKQMAANGKVKHDHRGLGYRVFSTYKDFCNYLKILDRKTKFAPNNIEDLNKYKDKDGFLECSIQTRRGAKKQKRYLSEAIAKIHLATGGHGAEKAAFPVYLDITDKYSLVWLVVIPEGDKYKENIEKADKAIADQSELLTKQMKHYE
jgi:hypothetical protein